VRPFVTAAAIEDNPMKFLNAQDGGLMKITVDRTKCEGYARCVQAAPKVFQLDNKMIAEVVDPQGDGDDKILLAARLCPTKAIVVEEEGTGKKLFPLE
jgi:ferredoxin